MAKKKAVAKRTVTESKQDFLDCCRWRNEGMTWQEIADRISEKYDHEGFSVHTIYNDFFKQLRRNVKIDATLFVRRIYNEIEAAKFEAMKGWERSQKTQTTKKEKETTGGKSGAETSNETIKKEMVGDPRFLAVYDKLLDKELRILELMAKLKNDGDDGDKQIEAVTIIQLPNNNR